MSKALLETENGVEFWRATLPGAGVHGYTVKDPRRTPEVWTFSDKQDAMQKYAELVAKARS